MTEQGLKTIIYPEIDDVALQDFVRKFNESLSNAYVPIGNTAISNNSSNTSTISNFSNGSLSDDDVDKIAEGATKGAKKTADNEPEVAQKNATPVINAISTLASSFGSKISSIGEGVDAVGTLKSAHLGKVAGIGLAVGVGAISVVEMVGKIFSFLQESSEPLRNVVGLFTKAFNLIWMPVGTILAMELMPFLRDTFARVGEFIANAMSLYETGGWSGLIEGAIETSFDVLIGLLTNTSLLEVIFKVMWSFFEKLNPSQIILNALLGTDGPLISMLDYFEIMASTFTMIWDVLRGDWSGVVENFNKIISIDEHIVSNIMEQLGNIWDRWSQVIPTLSPFREIIGIAKSVDDIVQFLTGRDIGEHIEDWGENIGAEWDKMTNTVGGEMFDVWKKTTPAGQLGKALGWWAEGGIVTQPTLGVAGEAGPEAIIPLNQFSQIANDIRTVNGGNTNVITINITGDNPKDIGEEVQRVLEKTVGKATSKLMWW